MVTQKEYFNALDELFNMWLKDEFKDLPKDELDNILEEKTTLSEQMMFDFKTPRERLLEQIKDYHNHKKYKQCIQPK